MNSARPDLRSPHEADRRAGARGRAAGPTGCAARVRRVAGTRGVAAALILEQIGACAARRVLDLACGAGDALLFIAAHAPGVRFGAIAGRAAPARRAAARLARAGLGQRCRVLAGDASDAAPYERIDAWWAEGASGAVLDIAFSLESLADARDAGRLLAIVSARLRPGGRLLLCGDVAGGSARTPAERRWLEEIRAARGGRDLMRRTAVERLAGAAGLRLVECRDLGSEARLRRSLLAAALAEVGRTTRARSPRWRRLVGEDALRRCLRCGVARTLFMVLAR